MVSGALTAHRQGWLACERAATAKIDLTPIMQIPNHPLKIGLCGSTSKASKPRWVKAKLHGWPAGNCSMYRNLKRVRSQI